MAEFSPLKGWGKKKQGNDQGKPQLVQSAGILLTSFLMAVALWFFVTSVQDPEASLPVDDVTVKVLHKEVLEEEGKICTILDNSDVIPLVTVTASRSVVDSLETDNIIATADLDKMTEDGLVPIDLTTNKYSDNITSITGTSKYVRVSVEERAVKSLVLETASRGAVAEGYILSSITTDQNLVRVTGPESMVEQVASAGVVIDVTGAGASISTNADIHLYDAEGNDIEVGKNLSLNIDKVICSVDILPTKEVKINARITGTPATGYRLTGEYTISPGTAVIAGRRAVLENVTEIVIPSSALDVTGMNRSFSKTLELKQYLPEGILLADENETVKVTVEIMQIVQEQIEAPADGG